MRRGKLLASGLSLIGVLACNGGKGTGDAGPDASYVLPPKPVSPLAACLRLAAAEANLEFDCGRLAEADVAGYVDAQCPPFLFASQEAAFDAGKLAYSGITVSCMEDALLPQSGSSTITCNVGYPELDPVCGQLAWGTLGPGESCNDQYACGAGLYCKQPTVGSCGTCTADVDMDDECGVNGAFCGQAVCNGEV